MSAAERLGLKEDRIIINIDEYGNTTAGTIPLALESARQQGVENLNQLLADTMTLRDLYKKHHWQVAGPTFHQLHLLYDKHYAQQAAVARRDLSLLHTR